MTISLPPQTSRSHSDDPRDGNGIPEERLADRFNLIDSLYIKPAVAELEKVYAYCVQEAEVDEIPLAGLNPYDFGPDVALARREDEIATDLRSFIATIQKEISDIRERAVRPLPRISRQEQFAAMLAQARELDFGGRREFVFSEDNKVTIDVTMVQDASGFYEPLLQAFMEAWEMEIDDIWEAARAAGRPAPDASKLPPVRLSMQPSFIFFTMLNSVPLNRTDALTMVAIGLVLGMLECFPGPDDTPPANLPASDLPIVIPMPRLIEAATRARAGANRKRS